MGTALKGLQSQAPLKKKLLDILLCLCLVIKANQVTSFWSLGIAGVGRLTAPLGREVQLCCKKFVLTLRSVVWLLTWLASIKLDAEAGLPSSELPYPESRKEGRRKAQVRKNSREAEERNDLDKHGNFLDAQL